MLDALIKSTGLRRSVLRYDATATANRMATTGNRNEMEELNQDQVIMLLIAYGDQPGSARWTYAENRFGPLPTGAPRTTE